MKLELHDRVCVAPNVHAREFDGETILLDLSHGDYFGVDDMGARIWAELKRASSPEEVALRLASDYDVEMPRLREDVRRFLEELYGRKLVVLAGRADV
jgi:hypothetical protein